jgi:hypothetical protein
MVRNLEELPNFLVINSGTESFGNSFISTFSLLLFALFQNYNFAFRDCNGKWTLPFLNAIVTPLHCIYLMQRLHHILPDICKYLMMESSIWQMVRTQPSAELVIDISEGPAGRGHGQAPRGNAPPPPPHLLVILEQLLTT